MIFLLLHALKEPKRIKLRPVAGSEKVPTLTFTKAAGMKSDKLEKSNLGLSSSFPCSTTRNPLDSIENFKS